MTLAIVSLPATKSVLLAAWWYAKAVKARNNGTLEARSFKAHFAMVLGLDEPPAPLLVSLSSHLANVILAGWSSTEADSQADQ